MKILLGIIVVFCLFGMIGAEDNEERTLFTYALMADVAAIVALNFV